MKILMSNQTFYLSCGDRTYIDSICKMYKSQGHKIITFSVHNENNFSTPYGNYFLENDDNLVLHNTIYIKSNTSYSPNKFFANLYNTNF